MKQVSLRPKNFRVKMVKRLLALPNILVYKRHGSFVGLLIGTWRVLRLLKV